MDRKCLIISHLEIGPRIFLLELEAGEVADSALPGQFVMLGVRESNACDPLLRRPFSIAWINRSKGTIYVLYRVVGRGTELLSKHQPGTRLQLLGPLGRGFSMEITGPRILIGGGMGLAPIIFLYNRINALGQTAYCILGARTRDEIRGILTAAGIAPEEVIVTTEDGSLGECALVTGPLRRILNESDDNVYIQACGPIPMLKAIYEIIDDQVLLFEASLESYMACGIGVCLGCAIKKKGETQEFLHVCKDGPVFNVRSIML